MYPTTIGDVDWWFQQLSNIPARHSALAPKFLRPFHFVSLAISLQQINAGGLQLPDNLASYAARMRVWEAAGLQCPIQVGQNDPDGKFLPVERLISRDAVDTSAASASRIVRTTGASHRTTVSVEICMSEIMENCFAHGGVLNGIPGVVCAQTWPTGSRAQIAIADPGTGIRTSLSENELLAPTLLAMNACEFATELGVTGKPGQGHAGYGLALTRQLLEANGGTLVVASHDEFFYSNRRTTTAGRLQYPWPGTLVVFEWNTDVPLEVKDVYANWPLPNGMTDDDYDF